MRGLWPPGEDRKLEGSLGLGQAPGGWLCGVRFPESGRGREGRLHLCLGESFSGDLPLRCLADPSSMGCKDRTAARYFAALRWVTGPSRGLRNGFCQVGTALQAVGLRASI